MSRIITKRGMKNPVQVIPGSGKEQFTILALASASGVHYPPFVVCWKKIYTTSGWQVGQNEHSMEPPKMDGWIRICSQVGLRKVS